jgi:hypothetical protein
MIVEVFHADRRTQVMKLMIASRSCFAEAHINEKSRKIKYLLLLYYLKHENYNEISNTYNVF